MPADSKKKSHTWIWIVICVIGLAWYYHDEIGTWSAGIATPDYTLSAMDLMSAYDKNEIAADLKYKDKVVILDGKFLNTGKDLLGDIYVLYNVGSLFGSVQCFFVDRYAKEVAEVESGRPLKVKGRVEGKFGNVVSKGCRIIK